MRILEFGHVIGNNIDQFGSTNVSISRVFPSIAHVHVSCMNFGHDGVVGYHQATVRQLFVVVAGSGWVRGESEVRSSIRTGQAAFWEKDEWHESGSDFGMTAIVIEGEEVEPLNYGLDV